MMRIGGTTSKRSGNQPAALRGRRRFLAELATGAAGVAAFPVVKEAVPARQRARAQRMRIPGESTAHPPVGQRFAPDGLPLRGLAGTYIGTEGRTVLVGIKHPPLGVIRVRLTGHTEVLARGHIVNGDVSHCRVGDRVNVGTYFGSDGARVAQYVNVNALAYWAEVTALTDESVTAVPYYAGKPWEPVTAHTIPWLTVYSHDPDAPPARGSGAAKAVLHRGDGIHMTCLGSSAASHPETVWSVTIHQVGGWKTILAS